jgi:NAD(P) transhydrogenase subunit alpha
MLMAGLTIFVISIFVGVEVITKVPQKLHTPLMSGSNAISGITIVGAILVSADCAKDGNELAVVLVGIAITLAMINVVGGFGVTHRMLSMFTKRKKAPTT